MPDHYRYKGILMILNGKVCTIPLTIDDKPLLNIQCWPDTEISTELTVDETAKTVFFVQRIENDWYIKKKERRYSQIHHLHRSNNKIRGIKFISFFIKWNIRLLQRKLGDLFVFALLLLSSFLLLLLLLLLLSCCCYSFSLLDLFKADLGNG